MGLFSIFSSGDIGQTSQIAQLDEIYSTNGAYGLKCLADPQSPTVDIVFVHGLTGNRETTWTHKKSKVFWPQALLPQDIPTARIWTYGYDADIIGALRVAGQNRLRDHGNSLAEDLAMERDERESNNLPLIFVAHSLGGLVTEQALLIAHNSPRQYQKDLFDSTIAIAFMGTPHAGSTKADWVAPLTNLANLVRKTNTELVAVLEPGSEMLANLQRDFHTKLEDCRRNNDKLLEIYCYYEELPVPGIGKIVPDHSAILSGSPHRSIHADHMAMTKFDSRENPGYSAITKQLRYWVRTAVIESAAQPINPYPRTLPPATYNSGGAAMFLGNITAGRDFTNTSHTYRMS